MARCVLVGLPGVGKTSVGRALARELGVPFVDGDDAFLASEGISVQDYLRQFDHDSFRVAETKVLQSLLARDVVIATGGGVVMSAPARDALRTAPTIWLDSPDATILVNIVGGDRPLLDDDPKTKLAELRALRDALYDDVASAKVDARGNVALVTRRVREALASLEEES